jgi:hypothetical protein
MGRMRGFLFVIAIIASLWVLADLRSQGVSPGRGPSPYNSAPTTQDIRDYEQDLEAHPMVPHPTTRPATQPGL